MTGAPIPPGADAVEMQEKVHALPGEGLGEITLTQAVRAGANVRSAGEDARAGEPLLAARTVLGIPEVALLWAQGFGEVAVPRRPRVGIVSTGDELCRPDEAGGDRIVDTNSRALALAVRRAGAEATVLGIARDEAESVERLLSSGLSFDVLLTSAGVSVGEKDFVRPALERLGVQLDFHGVAIKPGKPLAFGRKGSTLVFGLPGNPLSSLVTFELFVRPCLRALVGHPAPLPRFVPGRYDAGPSGRPLSKKPGLDHFVRVQASWREGAYLATPLSTQTSGAIRSGAGATHLMHVPARTERLESGAAARLLSLDWGA
jgi:molybdopterin molybdotransferase